MHLIECMCHNGRTLSGALIFLVFFKFLFEFQCGSGLIFVNSLINPTLLFWVGLGFEASARFCDYLVYGFGIHEMFKTFW